MNHLFTIDSFTPNQTITESYKHSVITALEDGQVIYMPHGFFPLFANEAFLLSPTIVKGKAKNISLSPTSRHSNGSTLKGEQLALLTGMMQRYMNYAKTIVETLLPYYASNVITGRTSFRPVEIKGRPSSYKKDDTRLHVDAFPATPTQSKRILRVFCNVNPTNQPRVWHLGEPFINVAERFLPRISAPNPLKAKFLKLFKITKSFRTPYDHYMLNIHDEMKKDVNYQQKVDKVRMDFPSGSTWITYTDVTSHAALSGQFLLEQTFYLAPAAMMDESKSPLRILGSVDISTMLDINP